jgi:hypothetical protein
MKPIQHITLNTGHTLAQPRSAISPEAIAALSPIVRAGRGQIPGMAPWNVEITREAGAASFHIQRGKEMVVMCVLCWREEKSAEAWASAEKLYLDTAEIFAKFGAPASVLAEAVQPEETPWLAVIFLPQGFALSSQQDTSWLGDFERCLAWTIIEADGWDK